MRGGKGLEGQGADLSSQISNLCRQYSAGKTLAPADNTPVEFNGIDKGSRYPLRLTLHSDAPLRYRDNGVQAVTVWMKARHEITFSSSDRRCVLRFAKVGVCLSLCQEFASLR